MHHNWPCPDNRSCFFNTLLNSSNPVSKHSSSGKELWSQFVTHKIKMVSPKRRESHGCCWSLGHIYVLHQWPSAGPMCKHDQPKTKEFVLNLWGLPKRLVSLVKCEEESRMSPPSASSSSVTSLHLTSNMPFSSTSRGFFNGESLSCFPKLPRHCCCLPPSPPSGQSLEQNWQSLQCFLLTYKSSVLVPILVA